MLDDNLKKYYSKTMMKSGVIQIDDNYLNDENLYDFSQLEDTLDKAGAGNEEDDGDDETPDTTTSLLSQDSVSVLP